jgi:hypothetical protein
MFISDKEWFICVLRLGEGRTGTHYSARECQRACTKPGRLAYRLLRKNFFRNKSVCWGR